MKCREEGDSDKRSKSLEKVLRFECLSMDLSFLRRFVRRISYRIVFFFYFIFIV